ncbi:class I SAM-dependent methyltransferase [Microbacterium luticocti]|uniref:class I SAM-dependent methyltransferase n=1 Tax=Microbacterium luticocti TaxID=451764 RepID=UPI000415773F|nr:class I SAM-dependent methyltransferase [Microbacterium luticocti]
MVDEALARSFRGAGEDYHRYRPGFPAAAAQAMLSRPVEAVLDLGAGTGKLTVQLVQRARRVIAVDPSEQMLAVLRAHLPNVDARVGTAERIPVGDTEVDAVTVAQAFHWFEREPACAEIRRVLRPGGTLGLVWNRTDPECSWDLACHRIAHPQATASGGEEGEEQVEQLPGFVFAERATFRWSETVSRADYVRRWQTVSTFLAADPAERARMTSAVEQVLATDAATRGREQLVLPQLTDVFVYRRAETDRVVPARTPGGVSLVGSDVGATAEEIMADVRADRS